MAKRRLTEWGIGLLIVLIGLYACFVWTKLLLRGRVSLQIVRSEMTFERPVEQVAGQAGQGGQKADGAFVASKKGRYYYPSNCGRARTLSVQNMLYFKDKMAAEAAGYQPYSGCK